MARTTLLRGSVCGNCRRRVYWRLTYDPPPLRTQRDRPTYLLCNESDGGVHRCLLTRSPNSPSPSAIALP